MIQRRPSSATRGEWSTRAHLFFATLLSILSTLSVSMNHSFRHSSQLVYFVFHRQNQGGTYMARDAT